MMTLYIILLGNGHAWTEFMGPMEFYGPNVSPIAHELCSLRIWERESVLICAEIYRMSTEMVACIAVEALSILEKVHNRG